MLLSPRSPVSLLHALLFKCTFVVRCGVYNLLTTHQSEKPHRSTFLLVALSPTLPKNTHNPHPNFPSAPGANLAVRRAKRSVLIFLSVSVLWYTERTLPSSASDCRSCIYVRKQLMVVHLLSDIFPPSFLPTMTAVSCFP